MLGYVVFWGSLTITELMWSIVGFIGISVSTWNLISVWGDYRFLRKHSLNGQLRSIALANVEQEIFAIIAQGAVLTIGIVAAKEPSVDPGRPASFFATIFIAALFTISVCIMVKSVRRRYWREIVINQGRRAERVKNKH